MLRKLANTIHKNSLRLGSLGTLILFTLTSQPVLAADTGFLTPFDMAWSTWGSDFSPNHEENVDDGLGCNGLTDYNMTVTSTGSGIDWYQVRVNTIPDGSTVNKIEIVPCLGTRPTVGGTTTTIRVHWRWNGGTSSGSQDYVNVTGNTPVEQTMATWSGLSLSKNASSKLDVGVQRISGAGISEISRIRTRMTY